MNARIARSLRGARALASLPVALAVLALSGGELLVAADACAQANAPSAETVVVRPASAPRGGQRGTSPAGPAVMLLVDWRTVPAEDAPVAPAGGAGGYVVGTRSPVPPGWTATRSRDAAPAPVTTVRVMNGHEAAWRVDAAHVRPYYEFVWTAQGQGIVSRDTVVHAARSLQATPRWPGGDAPVTLELAVAASQPRSPAGGDAEREAGLRTTVQLAFDEWLGVARLGDEDVQVRVRRR
jgi:hypothetical protein